MSVVYADASALVKLLVAERGSDELHATVAANAVVSSELAAVELRCVARRRGFDEVRAAEALEAIEVVALSADVVGRARETATTPPLRTLDALHLATATLLAERLPALELLAFDAELGAAARAAGLTVRVR